MDRFEAMIPGDVRRRNGAHYTPDDLARRIASLAVDEFVRANGRLPRSVCDPTCGAGGFLLAVAEELRLRGVSPSEVLDGVVSGVEIDAGAAAAARWALTEWGREHGIGHVASPEQITVADVSTVVPDVWPNRPPDGFDMVIGNPPFLSQLATDTARSAAEQSTSRDRFGALGPYADAAAVHLAAAVDLLAVGGVAAMVQPVSMLSARDSGPLRSWISERCALPALWISDEHHFDAAVLVCAPVVLRGVESAVTDVHSDSGVITVNSPVGGAWARLAAVAAGVPDVEPLDRPPCAEGNELLSSMMTATAGFRDEFYALGAAIDPDGEGPRLISTGMIDPLWCRWNDGSHRIAGERWARPHVDMTALEQSAPRVAEWARRRLRPKVLVATQTKVVETIVDVAGDMVPLTPVISVEPRSVADLWKVAAVLSAPPNVARLAALQWGSGRSADSLRIPARLLGGLPLPTDDDLWEAAAALIARSDDVPPDPATLVELGRTMTAAYGLPSDHPVLQWWLRRIPPRLGVGSPGESQ